MIEDDYSDVKLLEMLLKMEGLDVDMVKPWDAVETNRKHLPRIVQLDGLEGACFELHDQLKKDNPKAHYFLYTANQHPQFLAQAQRQGLRVFKKGLDDDVLEYVKSLPK